MCFRGAGAPKPIHAGLPSRRGHMRSHVRGHVGLVVRRARPLRNCEMIRTLIFETSGRPYALGAKSFQTPSVPIDKSYIHSGPFAKKVFKVPAHGGKTINKGTGEHPVVFFCANI